MEQGIVLFDGVCNLCNASVNFIINRDPQRFFRFAALQSEAGRELVRRRSCPEDLRTMVLIEDERCFTESTAALRIARRLSGLWPVLYAFIIVPPFLRNSIYRVISRHRYRWFGKSASCRVPTPALRERFLD